MFDSFEKHQAYIPLHDSLRQHWRSIREEALELVAQPGAFSAWQERNIYLGQWDVFGLRWQGQWLSTASKAPMTSSLLRPFEGMLANAGFSLMQPRTHITPHRGYTSQVLRAHLGLVVPSGVDDLLALRVGDEVRTWTEGQWLLFDDTLEHEAWNKSDQMRIVLLIDLHRATDSNRAQA